MGSRAITVRIEILLGLISPESIWDSNATVGHLTARMGILEPRVLG